MIELHVYQDHLLFTLICALCYRSCCWSVWNFLCLEMTGLSLYNKYKGRNKIHFNDSLLFVLPIFRSMRFINTHHCSDIISIDMLSPSLICRRTNENSDSKVKTAFCYILCNIFGVIRVLRYCYTRQPCNILSNMNYISLESSNNGCINAIAFIKVLNDTQIFLCGGK